MTKQPTEKTEECFKCHGDGFTTMDDGSMPCFRCSTTGRLPLGTAAQQCECGGKLLTEVTEDGFDYTYECDKCINGVRLAVSPEPRPLSCGCLSHENGGPSDYPAKCRR